MDISTFIFIGTFIFIIITFLGMKVIAIRNKKMGNENSETPKPHKEQTNKVEPQEERVEVIETPEVKQEPEDKHYYEEIVIDDDDSDTIAEIEAQISGKKKKRK